MKNTEQSGTPPVTKLASDELAAVSVRDSNARATLQHWVRAPTTPQRVVQRSRIVLMALDGIGEDEIAASLDVSRPTVKLWTERFEASGPDGLLRAAPGRGRHAVMSPDMMWDRLRQANLLGPNGLPVSIRRAAASLGVSASSVWRAARKVGANARSPQRKPPSAG